jgi:Flp pilus assembly protein TadG
VSRLHRRAGADDRGFVGAFTAAVVVAFIWLIAAVFDGGRWIRAQSDTFGIAAAAARAGAQEVDEASVLNEGELRLNEAAARDAAEDYLSARGLTGTVRVDDLEVTVTAHDTVGFRLLPVGHADIDATATARATDERAAS